MKKNKFNQQKLLFKRIDQEFTVRSKINGLSQSVFSIDKYQAVNICLSNTTKFLDHSFNDFIVKKTL